MGMSGGRIRTFFDGRWHEGDLGVAGAATHGLWQGSCVFDGARAFEGVTPDLEAHCARVNRSAVAMGLAPTMSTADMVARALEGVRAWEDGASLYIRPMYWAESGDSSLIGADPETTVFALCIEELPMPPEEKVEAGIAVCLSSFRRPLPSMAVTEAKAACLYPNNARMVREAKARGFDNAVSLDGLGNVAELATSNLFLVKDGTVATPIPNGTFLNGITRQRILKLLREAGVRAEERVITPQELSEADELFSTGNALKVMPITRFEGRELPYGPVARKARDLYWAFAHS